MRGDVFAAFLNHPLDPVFGDEILVGDLNDFEIALPGFCPERGFRQTATKEQLAGVGKGNRFVVLDGWRDCFIENRHRGLSTGCPQARSYSRSA
ncbi:hypothetical protein [Rhizobium leguminosarum]|uniref:hypothetical protein n=1 Tax=Rhizobium leguminosarum TaxID=384 RepID=UPI0013EF0329|nr:hypothetical protein [Rhizobium leguminosarum]